MAIRQSTERQHAFGMMRCHGGSRSQQEEWRASNESSLCGHQMSDRLGHLSAALDVAALPHSVYDDCIHVSLPGGFGILELKLWQDGSDSIQLIPGDFHTHSELLALEYNRDKNLAFATLVGKIFASELWLVEETSRAGETRRTIESSLENYVHGLPEGSSYRVING